MKKYFGYLLLVVSLIPGYIAIFLAIPQIIDRISNATSTHATGEIAGSVIAFALFAGIAYACVKYGIKLVKS